jgi:glutamate dehydrogenase/leucine dehydrogenase
LQHPQEGVVQGHFGNPQTKQIQIKQLQEGVSKRLTDAHFSPNINKHYVVADMITGYGVAEAVKHFYALHGQGIKGKRAIIQGWGNVGAAAAWYLAKEGVLITGIIDRGAGIISQEGLNFDDIHLLFENKTGNTLVSSHAISFEEANEKVWSVGAEIFIPAAASRLVKQDQVEQLINNGLEVISCGANVPFADQEIFFGPIGKYTDSKVSLIPDFIANCGMARVFAYLMQPNIDLSDAAIFNDASTIIGNALKKVYEINPGKTEIAKTAFEIALKQLV